MSTTSVDPRRTRPGAVPLTARLLGPDLARGGMLLLIALANVHVFAYGFVPGFRGYPLGQHGVDRVVTVVQMLLVDGRAFPLFAALFGYGLVQISRRRAAADEPAGNRVRLLRRRGAWLVALGFAHAMLLFTADIVAIYGLVAVALAGVLVTGSDRRLLTVAAVLAVPALAFGAARGLPAAALGLTELVQATPLLVGGDPVTAMATRLTEWAGGLLRVLGLAPAVLLGAWAGRREVLGRAREYRRPLRLVAVLGAGLGVAGGVPAALMAAGVWTGPSTGAALLAGTAHLVSGYAVAAAYVAVFALLGTRLRPGGRLVGAVVAAGQRSLTLYLGQSLVFVVLLDPTFLGLGDRLPLWLGASFAVGTWTLGLAAAVLMARTGVRGPAEQLLRRLVYGRRG